MSLSTLWLSDFRCFAEATLEIDPDGLTVFRGSNGSGKTSLLEAIGWLATWRSFRGASKEILVRRGTERAILRAQTAVGDHDALVEAELSLVRPGRVQVNRQTIRRRSDMARVLQVSVFSPSDRRLVEGGPGERRDYLDDLLVESHPRLEALVDEVEQILRQRGALLRQSGNRPDRSALDTLDVWDTRLSACGSVLAEERESLSQQLQPLVADAYGHLAGSPADRVSLAYRRSWNGELADALASAREVDLRRQVSTVGPHRDEMEIVLDTSPARTHASQGEQRCIALALRLASHEMRTRASPEPPVLLLDDVFSELDDRRSAALVERLPKGQVLLTTAVDPPAAVGSHQVIEVAGGEVGEKDTGNDTY